VLTDQYASSPVSQARALAELLNEGYGQLSKTVVQSNQSKAIATLTGQGLVEVINQSKHKPKGMIDGGRGGILGNPFDMQGDERLREPVCEAHSEYFERVYFGGEEPVAAAKAIAKEQGLSIATAWKRPSREAYVALIDKIDEAVASGKSIEVGCYCVPKACHLERLADHWNRDRTLDQEQTMDKQIVEVYADGGARPNPGKGGYGVVAVYEDGSTFEMGGSRGQSTNNAMELRGAIAALEHLVECEATGEITFKLDSEYVRKGIASLPKWEANDWTTSQGTEVKNKALWQKLSRLLDQVEADLSFEHVDAHRGDRHNERCDEIATCFIQGRDPQLNQVQPAPEIDLQFPCYLSLVQGELAVHANWDDCKARTEFQSGAKTKKCKTMAEIEMTVQGWGLSIDDLQKDTAGDRNLESWVELPLEKKQSPTTGAIGIWTGAEGRQMVQKLLSEQRKSAEVVQDEI